MWYRQDVIEGENPRGENHIFLVKYMEFRNVREISVSTLVVNYIFCVKYTYFLLISVGKNAGIKHHLRPHLLVNKYSHVWPLTSGHMITTCASCHLRNLNSGSGKSDCPVVTNVVFHILFDVSQMIMHDGNTSDYPSISGIELLLWFIVNWWKLAV